MKKILINTNSWQTRIAITRDGQLQNIYFAAPSVVPLERVYFKGIVTKVLPGIQTAFVDIGQERAGFLHISEIDRELALDRIAKTIQLDEEDFQRKRSQLRRNIDIAKIFREGDAILTQVSKEPVYEKGAKLTTCFTLPGRFVVLMPNIDRIGVSKKIEDRTERARLKDVVRSLLPKGMGAIIRTTSSGTSEKDITKDVSFLVSTWNTIQKKFQNAEPKEKIHSDIPLPLQIVRDHLDEDVDEVIVDSKQVQKEIYNYVKMVAPEFSHLIKFYDKIIPLFEYFDIEKQIEAALRKKVPLRSGGSLIIESTEAMTVVDVNTGRFTGKKDMEETILKTNLEAAEETVRQLRLRNIGGLIVIDFIDMAQQVNRHKLTQFFERMLKERDKFQSVVLKVSEFGLIQMTRKRSGKTLVQQLTQTCPTCRGSGHIESLQSECFEILQRTKEYIKKSKQVKEIALLVHPDIFDYLTTKQYDAVIGLEKQFGCLITLVTNAQLARDQYKIEKK